MKYKHNTTKKKFKFTIESYNNIPVDEVEDKDGRKGKIVEVWDAGIIVRRIMTAKDILLTNRKWDFIVSKEWFESQYTKV